MLDIRVQPAIIKTRGDVAQLEERLLRMQEVRGSSPLISTMNRKELQEVGNRGVAGLFVFQGNVYHFFTTWHIVEKILFWQGCENFLLQRL